MVDDEGDWLDPPWPKFFGGVALAPVIDGFQVARNWVKYVDTGMSHSVWEKKKKKNLRQMGWHGFGLGPN